MKPPQPIDIVYTKVFLTQRQWSLLFEWCNRDATYTVNGNGGGMQKRRLDWLSRMDKAERSILLTTGSTAVRRTTDDMTWIRNTIINRLAGGFQMRISNIFCDTHPTFSNLPIKPRKR